MATVDLRQSTIFSRLRGLLEVTRLVRTSDDLEALLAAIARTVSDSLGFRTVIVNLYRREWNDFIVMTVYGSDEARKKLLGQVSEVAEWEGLLDQRFLQRGAYVIPAGEFDWEQLEGTTYTPNIAVSDDPTHWHPDDALFAPMRGADGALLGILSVDEPISGRKPSGDEIDVLVAVSEHAALAVQAAQESTRANRNREALQHLLDVSTRLNETRDTHDLLTRVCVAINEALGFEKVAVRLLGRDGRHETAAQFGFTEEEYDFEPVTADQLERLLQPEYELGGCFVIPDAAARELLPERPVDYTSQCDGRGPHAWQNHWLFLPLVDRRGRRIGYIWADDPFDRLLPDAERLQILRAFANQATTVLEQAAQFEEIQTGYQHHRALIDASPIAIVDFDLDGRVRSWNEAAARTFGWKPEEVIGRFSPIVPEDEREDFLGRLRLVAAGEPMQDIDVRRVHREGALIDINMSAAPILDAQGNAAGVIASMIDVTARKRSERMLAASEGRKDAILRAAHDSVVIVDHEGLVVEVNPATEEMFGWTRSEALGRQFLQLVVAPEHRSELEKVLRAGGGSLLGARLEINALRSDQRSFPAEAAITRVDLPGPQLFAVSLRDVTKRRDREQRLRQAEAKYRALVDQLPHATYVNSVGLPLQTTFVSPQIETMLGYAVSRWLQPGFFASVVHPEDRERVLSEVERTHTTSETFRLEYRLLAADGRVVWVLDETVAIRDDEYRPIMLQGSLVDVTERHAAESQPTLRAAAS